MLHEAVAKQRHNWLPTPALGLNIGQYSSGRARTLDLVCAMAVVVGLAVLLINWHLATESSVIPYHDGSHHVANVASLVAATRAQGPGFFLAFADRSPSDALTYATLGISTWLFGPGRLSFGLVWTLCAAGLAAGLWFYLRRAQRPAVFASLALLLFLGLFQSVDGGARDTRVDIFATTLATLALLAATGGRWFAGALLVLVAAFAKGAAISLLVPLFILWIPFGYDQLRKHVRPGVFGLAKVVIVALIAAFFAVRIGPQTVSYNLMATGGSTLQDRVRIFATSAWGYIEKDPWFYVRDLVDHYHGWLTVGVVLLLILGVVSRSSFRELRLGLYSALALLYTWVLMTISPLHSNVLTIWFLPALALAMVFAGKAIARLLPAPVTLGAAALLLIPVALSLRDAPSPPRGVYAEPAAALVGQASEMAAFLDQEFAGRSTPAVLLVNFIWADPPLHYNYDVFRVLIQERLHQATIALDGWELGSLSNNWKQELDAQKSYPEILFVIQKKPGGIDAGPAVRDFIGRLQAQHPECLVSIAQPIETSDHGEQDALRLTPTTACRDALFSAAT